MKITCHACDAKYTIADEKVTGRTVKIKCKKCGATIVVNADPSAAGAPMSTSTPAYAEPQAPGPGDDDGLMATRVFGGDTGGANVTAPEWTVSLTGEDERQMSQLQIAEEIQRGAITADTYVWRDGMTDWLPVSQIEALAPLLTRAAPAHAAPSQGYAPAPSGPVQDEPEMGLAGTMIMTDNSAPSPFAAPRPAAGGSPYAPPPAIASPAAATPALSPVSQPTAARRTNRAGGGVDVFAAAAETRDAGGPPRPPTPAARLGERNENSVLFSLSALTATENAAAKDSGKNNDDAVFDFGPGRSGNGSRSAVDDLMNIGGGAIGGPMLAPPPLLAPVVEPPPAPAPMAVASAQPMSMGPGSMPNYAQPQQQKSKTGLIIGVAAVAVVLGGLGVFFAMSGGDKPTGETIPTSVAATTPGTAATAATTPSAAASTTAAPEVTDTPAASGAPAASSAVVAANDTQGKAPSSGTGGGPAPSSKASATSATPTATAKASADPVPTPTASTAPEPASGSRDFNKGAATTALSGAAGAAKGCKQPGGPTGSASVRVVFAPSGNVTSANVQGPPFAGTPVGGCIAAAFRGAHVPPFDGSPVAVTKTVNIN